MVSWAWSENVCDGTTLVLSGNGSDLSWDGRRSGRATSVGFLAGSVVVFGCTINNQLRTGTDKGNPTV